MYSDFKIIIIVFVLLFTINCYSQTPDTLWYENFEGSWSSDWHITFGTWEVGTPASGPGGAYTGQNCAATVLNGNYGANVDSTRLVRHTSFVVPAASENPRLRFWHWYYFQINDTDYGKVQIKVNGSSQWEDLPDGYYHDWSGGVWTRPYIDLSAYAGLTVQISFYFHSDGGSQQPGWYIDDITIETGDLVFNSPEDWESGYDDWYVDYGTWELGTPSSGPGAAYQGANCVGTRLAGDYYHDIDSTRLISPPFNVPSSSENPALRFWHWYYFQINDDDYGEVQIRNVGNGESWTTLIQYADQSSIWFETYIPLTNYADSTVQISFYFHSDGGSEQPGWYIDSLYIVGYTYPLMFVETDSIDFGNVLIDSTGTQQVVIQNIGTETLNINSINITGVNSVNFDTDTSLFSVAPGDSQIMQVNFTPDSLGVFSALLSINSDGGFNYVSLSGIGVEDSLSDIPYYDVVIPTEYTIQQNFPNPFNPTTSIRFGLPKANQVKIDVYNMLGQRVEELLNENKQAGYHSVKFIGSDFSSGIYFYKIQAGEFIKVKKMLLVR